MMGSGRPQDGCRSWVVLFGSAVLAYFLSAGCSVLAILLVDIIKIYPEDTVIITWTVGIYLSMGWLLSVPITWIMFRYGRRKIGIIAGLVTSTSFITASFSNHSMIFFLFGGALTGASGGVYFCLGIMNAQKYFSKHMSLAQGIVMSAMSLGFLTYPPLVRLLGDHFSWRGAMFLHAAINLNVLPACLLMKEQTGSKRSCWRTKNRSPALTSPVEEEKKSSHVGNQDAEKLREGTSDKEDRTESLSQSKGDLHLEKDSKHKEEEKNTEISRSNHRTLPLLLQYPSLAVCVLAIVFVQCGNIVPFVLTPLMSDHLGSTKMQGALLVSLIASVSLIFRSLCGHIADRECVKKKILCGCASVLGGCLTALIASANSYGLLAGIIVGISIPSATFMGTWASVISDMVEPQLISVAVSYGCMGIGLAHLIVVGNSGSLLKLTGSPRLTFLIAGCIEVVGGILFLGIHFCSKSSLQNRKRVSKSWEKREGEMSSINP